MTAPLYFKPNSKANPKETLPILTNRLLDAIDDNDLEKIERYLDLVLERKVSPAYICMIYRYVQAHGDTKIREYFGYIILTISNISIYN